MFGLPEGWESDYDGKRWFYRYKPNGLTQFQFPQPGDEFPNFVGDNVELEPEERLASERQLRERNTQGGDSRSETKRSGSGRKRVGGKTAEDEFGMAATGYFDPSSFMYFGPDDEDCEESIVEANGGEQNEPTSDGNEEPPASAVDSLQSPGATPSTITSELATSPSVAADARTEPIRPVVELQGDNERKRSPVGSVPELASPHTAKCADELAPIELDAVSSISPTAGMKLVHSEVAELSADNQPVKRRTPPPRLPPTPMNPVDSYPLVSASFAYAPLRNAEDSTNSTKTKLEDTRLEEKSDIPKERPMSAGEGQAKYHPFTPGQHTLKETARAPQRSSMILSSTTVLQSQHSELSHIDSGGDGKSMPESGSGLGRPKMFEPPVDPKRVSKLASTPLPKIENAPISVPGSLQAPQKLSPHPRPPNDPPRQPKPHPLPGSGARHESISSHPGHFNTNNSNPNSSQFPSVLKPAHRRSGSSFSQPRQPINRTGSPSESEYNSAAYGTPEEFMSTNLPSTQVAGLEYSTMGQSPPFVEPIAPLKPRKSPSPERDVSNTIPRPQLPHSSYSMPDTLDQISDVISELNSIMSMRENGYYGENPTSTISQPTHGSNQQQQPDLTHSQRTSRTVSGSFSREASVEGSRMTHYSIPDASVDRKPAFLFRTTTQPISSTESNQGQTYPSPLSVSSIPLTGEISNASIQSNSPRSAPGGLNLSRSSSLVDTNVSSNTILKDTRPSSTQGVTKDPFRGYGHPQSPAELPSHDFDVLPSPQSQVSSLYGVSSAASSYLQTGGKSQTQLAGDMSELSSISARQEVHELPATSERPSQPPAAEVSPPKPKPFPMLPGQVTPMPSQIGSSPVVTPPATDTSIKCSPPPSKNSHIMQPVPSTALGPQQPVYGNPTGKGQRHSQPLPQLQMRPGQNMIAQGQTMPVNMHIVPAQQSKQRPQSFHMGTAAIGQQAFMQQPPAQNGAATGPEEGRGVRKWAKKIFKSSSAKQNVTMAGAPVAPGPGPTETRNIGHSSSGVSNSIPTTISDEKVQAPAVHVHAQLAPTQSRAPFNLPTNSAPRAMVSDTTLNTSSSAGKSIVAAQSHQRHSLPPTTHNSLNNSASYPYSPPQTPSPLNSNRAAGKIGTNITTPNPVLVNGAPPVASSGYKVSHGGKEREVKAVDYSGGDWGDDWN